MTTATMTRELSHAEANAKAWAESIAAAYEAHQFCAAGFNHSSLQRWDLSEEAKACLREHHYDGTNHSEVAEWIEEAMQEAPLAVDVRSGWTSRGPLRSKFEAEEFQILLSTGGPALRITGYLGTDLEPVDPRLEHQDWGTPWTQLFDVNRDALQWFASLFWFGEA
jgi:hypothetical protein